MAEKEKTAKALKPEATKVWTPPDACPECGNPFIIPVFEEKAIVCPECRKKFPC